MKNSLILLFAICSFTAANCQIVANVNNFQIVEFRQDHLGNEKSFTVPVLQDYLNNRKIEISYSNEKRTIENAIFFETDFQFSNLVITEYKSHKEIYIIIRTADCLIRFERNENAEFNVECNCLEL